jgi:hypothetical protein
MNLIEIKKEMERHGSGEIPAELKDRLMALTAPIKKGGSDVLIGRQPDGTTGIVVGNAAQWRDGQGVRIGGYGRTIHAVDVMSDTLWLDQDLPFVPDGSAVFPATVYVGPRFDPA